MNEKLKVGEKYLSVQIEFGGAKFHLPAFKNTAKKKPSEPDYKGQNIAIWISTKKEKSGVVEEDFV